MPPCAFACVHVHMCMLRKGEGASPFRPARNRKEHGGLCMEGVHGSRLEIEHFTAVHITLV